ncbi:MAG: hypothetical protein LBF28_01950 [Rickettsiales bacterium]|jgi:hypothetical protein|nr:hypothetical protein [Rickettsiales bacterium]
MSRRGFLKNIFRTLEIRDGKLGFSLHPIFASLKKLAIVSNGGQNGAILEPRQVADMCDIATLRHEIKEYLAIFGGIPVLPANDNIKLRVAA